MSRYTIAAMALAWISALILLAVFTTNGHGSQDKTPSTQTGDTARAGEGREGGRDGGGGITLKATTGVQMTGACRWQTGTNGLPLTLAGSRPNNPKCPLVVDEFTAASGHSKGWAPWTHRPVCTEARRDKRGRARQQQYCVFTDATFRGGRGLSVIAAPHGAAAMADTLDDSGVPPRLRDHPSTPLRGDTAREHGTTAEGNAFAVQDMPGRGRGVVATRRIRRGELVFVDYVTVLSQNTFTAPDSASNGDEADPEQIMQLLQVAVAQLPRAQNTRVHALAHSLGGERVRDILRTNVFGGITIAGEPHIGLFPLGSRINHNCQPNTFWRYTPGYQSQEVIAMRDIEPGEEVTHSYISLGIVYEERQQKMRDWGFNCTCSLCTASVAHRRLSDQRRRRLLAIHAELAVFEKEAGEGPSSGSRTAAGSTAADRGAKRLGETVDEMLFLIDKEQAWPLLCDYYPAVARAYLAIDLVESARKYWRASGAAWTTYGGDQHENGDELRALGQAITAREEALVVDSR